MRWLAVLTLCSCSVIYDTDELQLCDELPLFTEPVCQAGVATCLGSCATQEECFSCYDTNRNGELEEAEVLCIQCGVTKFYECLSENGCARETELAFCCQDALCGPAGCPEADNPCELEVVALNECFDALPDPTVCNAASVSCFRL